MHRTRVTVGKAAETGVAPIVAEALIVAEIAEALPQEAVPVADAVLQQWIRMSKGE